MTQTWFDLGHYFNHFLYSQFFLSFFHNKGYNDDNQCLGVQVQDRCEKQTETNFSVDFQQFMLRQADAQG